MIKENELQKIILNLIQNDELYARIINCDEVNDILKIDENEDFIPNLSIDYMLKYQYLQSARNVLEAINGELQVITGDVIKNISLNASERLMPDFILVNESSGQIIIIELKRDSQSEREAITEILGYAQEVKNHLPFLSEYDLLYIIVSTNFDTLLKHSVSSLILNGTTNLLCLKPDVNNESCDFEVFIPDSWTDICQSFIPPEAFSSYTLVLYNEKNKWPSDKYEGLMLLETACELIARHADRTKSHGFCIAWENCYDRDNYSPYCITIFVLNPRSFTENIMFREDLRVNNPLMDHLKKTSDCEFYNWPESTFRICDSAKDYLDNYCNPTWETAIYLSDFHHLYYQARPLHFKSWGSVGDFVQYFYTHPGVKKHYLPEAYRRYIGFSDPDIGLQIINYLTGKSLFRDGNFSPGEIYQFGKLVGMYLNACNTLNEDKERSPLWPLFFWLNLSLSAAIKEVGFRYLDSDISVAPPEIRIDSSKSQETIKCMTKFIDWFNEYFLVGEQHEMHRILLYYGLNFGPFQDKTFSKYFSINLKNLKLEFTDFTKGLIGSICEDIFINNNLQLDEDFEEQIKHLYLREYDFDNMTKEGLIKHFECLEWEDILENLDTRFFNIINKVCPGVFHVIKAEIDFSTIDWQWVKEKVEKGRSRGKRNMGIRYTISGELQIAELLDCEIMSDLASDEVYFLEDKPGFGVVRIIKWADLITGNY